MERGYHLGAPTPGPASFFALLGMVIVLTHFTGVTSIRPSMALLLSWRTSDTKKKKKDDLVQSLGVALASPRPRGSGPGLRPHSTPADDL